MGNDFGALWPWLDFWWSRCLFFFSNSFAVDVALVITVVVAVAALLSFIFHGCCLREVLRCAASLGFDGEGVDAQ